MIKVDIDSIRVSLMSQHRIVILKDPLSGRYLPIFIGPCEAEAIAMKLQDVKMERPLTHDLLKSVIAELGGHVTHILVSDLRQDTFYAEIEIERDGETLTIDSRPSDAIALAVRLGVDIYVEETVMDRASITPDEEVDGESLERGEGATGESLDVFEDFVASLDLDELDDEDSDNIEEEDDEEDDE